MLTRIPYIHPILGPSLITPKRKPDALSKVNPPAPLPPQSPTRAINEVLLLLSQARYIVTRQSDRDQTNTLLSVSGMSTRSYQGCWTCKRRRRRCDNARPTCQSCARRGIDCEGYEVRLKWGSGIASRGRYTGAEKPLEESVPPRPKGRQRDLIRQKMRSEPQGQIHRGSPPYDDQVGHCLTWRIVKFDVMSPDSPLSSNTARKEEEEAIFNECE